MTNHLIYIHGLGGQADDTAESLKSKWTAALARSSVALQPLEELAETPGSHVRVHLAWWAEIERPRTRADLIHLGKGLVSTYDKVKRGWSKAVNKGYSGMAKRVMPVVQPNFITILRYLQDAPSGAFRSAVAKTLITELQRAQEGDRVCVIAHSMGTVVAYDVLSTWKRVPPALLITLGSPLGLDFVRKDLGKSWDGRRR
jgi:hypothetical protein